MQLAKVKILKSIKSIKTGYGPTGTNKHLVSDVFDFIQEQDAEHRDGWVELFDVLCITKPQSVSGGSWRDQLIALAAEISDAPRKPKKNEMTLEEIQAFTEKAQQDGIAPADTTSDAHAAIIATAGATLPEPTPSQKAVEADAKDNAAKQAAHADVIAQATSKGKNKPKAKAEPQTGADKARAALEAAQEDEK